MHFGVKKATSPRVIYASRYQIRSIQSTGIDPFHAQHATVFTDARMQLGATDVNPHHHARAVLQQAVGKAAGALAHVQAGQAVHGQPHPLERGFELEAATGHVAGLGVIQQPHLGRIGNLVTIFGDALPHLALQPFHAAGNQALGLRPGGGQATLNE